MRILRSTFVALLGFLLVVPLSFAQPAFEPWEALVDDSWIYIGPPQVRILMHTVNAGDYEVGFDQARSDDSARGMNSLQFSYGGLDTGHLVATALTGSFAVKNIGDARTFTDLLILVAIDADELPDGFEMSLGLHGAAPYEFDTSDDFGHYNQPTYDSGRPSGYYSATSPSDDAISHAFGTGMVTLYALTGVNLAPLGASVTVEYAFDALPGDAVFSVYGLDANVGWIFHTNRAFLDGNRPTQPVSTFTVTPVPGDFDGDGEVNLNDFREFVDCQAGPNEPPNPPSTTAAKCLIVFDMALDDDVDLLDFAWFQQVSDP